MSSMLFNSIAATAKWLDVEFRPGIAITDVARFWGTPLLLRSSSSSLSIPLALPTIHYTMYFHSLNILKSLTARSSCMIAEMSNLDYVRGSSAGSVVLWVDDRPNQQALADCEDPAYVFSAGTTSFLLVPPQYNIGRNVWSGE